MAPTMNDGFRMRRNIWRIQPGNGTSRQMRSSSASDVHNEWVA